MIPVFTMITVGTKNLKTGRPVIGFKPLVELWPMMKEVVLFSKLSSIVVNVVNVQKKRLGFSTTSANVTSISHYHFVLKAIVIGKGVFSALLWIVFAPFYGTFSVLRRMLFAVSKNPVNRPQFPFFAILHKALVTLPSVPTILILCFTTPVTGFNHGLTPIVKSIFDYDDNVKGKVQRPERNLVGASVPKRIATRTVEDMVCSAWRHAAAL
ncbi:MAG TPA: hypothetical protein VLH56_17280 [Dissulfurispiraceae bacterium]|nr:hypothetical protein [Dissulfurispiraceae bacterium]